MATTTTNFGWDIPQSTDLVKDGATAIAALGQDIDTALVDLKGGTTGQVLAKASGTDLDFSWVAQDDSNAIQNAIVDAKGDLIAATAADTPARLAVGTNGYVLTADSAEATGLKWAAAQSGALVKLASNTFSAATTVNPGAYFNSTYKRYKLFIQTYGSSNNANLQLRFRYASNATALTSGYYGSWYGRDYQGSAIASDTSNGSSVKFGNVSSDSNENSLYELTFVNIGQGSNSSPAYKVTGINRSKGCGLFGGGYASTSAQSWDGIDFGIDTGTITGSYTLYGLAD